MIVADTFGTSATALYFHADNSFAVIPEPETVTLLVLGIPGLVATRRRGLR